MFVFVCVLYVLIGLLLGIPYCFLAGWDRDGLAILTLTAPAFLITWLFFAASAGVLRNTHQGQRRLYLDWRAVFRKDNEYELPGSHLIFWIWTIYCLLPIIFRWSAVLLNSVGYESVATILYDHRYKSPLYALMVVCALIALFVMFATIWEVGRSKTARLTRL